MRLGGYLGRPTFFMGVRNLKKINIIMRTAIATIILILSANFSALSADRLPVSEAGSIGEPSGQIAFIRDSDIWIMNADGSDTFKVAGVGNADGRISWGPNGKRLVFTRSGQINLRTPQNGGGVHKIYDIYMAYIDSAKNKNLFYAEQLTSNLGGRDPEWSQDGKQIVYSYDLFANTVNSMSPNYQVSTMNPDGSSNRILRLDWRNLTDLFTTPSINFRNEIAFVLFFDLKPQGIAVLDRDDFMVSLDSIRSDVASMAKLMGPSWSPDAKWLAYVSNDIDDAGLYISTADLKKRYLVHKPAGLSMSTRTPAWSPNSKWLSFGTTDGSIWICDILGNNLKRLTNTSRDWFPAWSKK